WSIKPSTLSSELFPAPDGPITLMNSPAATSRLMLRNSQLRPPARATDFSMPPRRIMARTPSGFSLIAQGHHGIDAQRTPRRRQGRGNGGEQQNPDHARADARTGTGAGHHQAGEHT